MNPRTLLVAVCALSLPAAAQDAGAPDGPARLDALLRATVRPSGVNYPALRARLPDLVAAHAWFAAHGPRSTPAAFPTAQARLAYWLNAYNLTVLRGVAEAPPTMRNVLTFLPDSGFFRARRWRVDGRDLTLDHIENTEVRPVFRDARVHFALNCAARSCPPLRAEAYTAARVNAQLDEQARRYLNTAGAVAVDAAAHTVRVTQLFEWFRDDFLAGAPPRARGVGPTVPGFVYAFASPTLREALTAACGADLTGCTVNHAAYDWSLNEAR
ncbi:MAG: DUF547 domain-containing protein [Polyangiales bacterium]